jgi:uncharacterized protein YecT (DUF1311 family)
MAYGKIAYNTFYQFGSDLQIDIEFYQDNFLGDASVILLGGTPILIRMLNEGNTKFDAICGTEATVTLVAKPDDDFSWLFVGDDFELMVIVKVDSVEKWRGYVLAGQYEELYLPYREIIVTASDQLGLLNYRSYTYGSPAVSPSGYQKNILILANILSKTNISKAKVEIPIRCTDDLFEQDMDYADTDDPMEQACANQDLWVDDAGLASDCKTILKDILTPKQCRVLQSAGQWWIQSIRNLEDANIDYRDFTNSGIYSGYGIQNPQKRTDTEIKLIAGGFIKKEAGWLQRELEVMYGLKRSLIPSFALPDSAFTDDYTITGWTNTGNKWSRISSNNRNVMQAYTNPRTAFDDTLHIETPAVSATTTYNLTLTIETGRSKNAAIWNAPSCYVMIKLAATGVDYYYAYDSSTNIWSWVATTPQYLNSVFFPRVNNIDELVTQTVSIKSIPADGDLTVIFFAPWKDSGATFDDYFWFTNIEITGDFIETLGEDILESQVFTCEINAETSYIPSAETIKLSDCFNQTLAYYYKGFMKVGIFKTNYTELWARKVQMGDSSTYLPLVPYSLDEYTTGWINNGWYSQYWEANRILRGNFKVLGTNSFWFHNTINFVHYGIILMPIDMEIDLKSNIVNGTFIEIKPDLGDISNPSTLALKSRGTPGEIITASGGLVPTPGGAEGAVQFKSGVDFEGTEVTWDGTRLKTSDGLPLIDYRRDTQSIAAGEVIVYYLDRNGDPYPFESGDVVTLPPILWGVTADGETLSAIPYWDSEIDPIDGFKISFGSPVTVFIDVMITR